MLTCACVGVWTAELLRRSQENKEQRDKERLAAYYKKNFKVGLKLCPRLILVADLVSENQGWGPSWSARLWYNIAAYCSAVACMKMIE